MSQLLTPYQKRALCELETFWIHVKDLPGVRSDAPLRALERKGLAVPFWKDGYRTGFWALTASGFEYVERFGHVARSYR